MRIPIHSCTDLITNSSTVIFTYQDSAEPAMIEMINELFKAFGIDKKCEDVFDTVVMCDDNYRYTEYSDIPEGIEDVDQLVEDVRECKVPKPEWFNEVEGHEDSYSYYTPSTYLYVVPKKEEYRALAMKIKHFLGSTDHEATRDG